MKPSGGEPGCGRGASERLPPAAQAGEVQGLGEPALRPLEVGGRADSRQGAPRGPADGRAGEGSALSGGVSLRRMRAGRAWPGLYIGLAPAPAESRAVAGLAVRRCLGVGRDAGGEKGPPQGRSIPRAGAWVRKSGRAEN